MWRVGCQAAVDVPADYFLALPKAPSSRRRAENLPSAFGGRCYSEGGSLSPSNSSSHFGPSHWVWRDDGVPLRCNGGA